MNKRVMTIAGGIIASVLFHNVAKAQEKLYPNEFELKDVRLLKGPLQHARDLNTHTLLQYDVDRLLAGFRKQAALPAKAASYPNWDGLDGHVAGHYLSALAMNIAATGDAACTKRMRYIIEELKNCQDSGSLHNPGWGKGYIGAVPLSEKIWTGVIKGDLSAYRSAWVPWYNLHKIFAGLRDAWLYTGDQQARQLFLSACDWAVMVTAALTEQQFQSMLDTEHGGMNEVLADAWQMTQDAKYLTAAKKFSHRMLLDAMAAGTDNLTNKHANTQVPKAVGFSRIGELAHDSRYDSAASFFWQTVTTNRSLAFGGNSRREFFPAREASADFIAEVEGPETCNSYNMLKLTENLFRQQPLARYADYYERTLYNHILSTQHPDHGGYVYFTPARPNHYRVYSAPNQGMWCCVGSGMENHAKYNQFIYSHRADSLYINLFVASELNWREKNIVVQQQTGFPSEERTRLTITSGNGRFAMMIRYPGWVSRGKLTVRLNGKPVAFTAQPSSYIAIKRQWKKGDVVEVGLPMHTAVEQLPNLPQYIAFMRGPLLLGARSGTQDLKGLIANDGRWSHIASGTRIPLNNAPVLLQNNHDSLAGLLRPVQGKPMQFQFSNIRMHNAGSFTLEPFYGIHDSRYIMYWMALNDAQYKGYMDSLAGVEKIRQALDSRTVDVVAAGEQQPEANHFIQQQRSNTGNSMDAFWRDASGDGYFSYSLSTQKRSDLLLSVRYWGNETGRRNFAVYIDDKLLAEENIAGKWNNRRFYDIEYPLPESMLTGKENIRITFRPLPGNTAGPVYSVRLVSK